jgi:hypothetical protein
VKSGFSLGGDSYRDYQKQANARIAPEKCEDTQPSSMPEDWVVVCAVICEPVSIANSLLSGNFAKSRPSGAIAPIDLRYVAGVALISEQPKATVNLCNSSPNGADLLIQLRNLAG